MDGTGFGARLTRRKPPQKRSPARKHMIVAPGQYDLWIEPADGGRAEKLAEKIEVTAGKATVIE